MRHLASINDPISRMLIKLLVDCIAVLYAKQKFQQSHWIQSGMDNQLETNPRWKLKWR